MIMKLKTWNEKHKSGELGGIEQVFTANGAIITDLLQWCFPDSTIPTASLIHNFILWKFGSALMVDYDPDFLGALTYTWHISNAYRFAGLAASMRFEYNPIDNYDRTETETTERTPDIERQETRNTTTADGGTTTTAGTNTDTQTAESVGKVAPFDSAVFANAQDSTTTAGGTSTDSTTITHGKTETNTGTVTHTESGTETVEREIHAHGNIGTMSTQEMIERERRVVNFELLELYVREWVKAISCGVWGLGCDVATDV